MKNLLKTVTKCIDKFARKQNITRLAAIIGGEAVILHGIPRTTIDKLVKSQKAPLLVIPAKAGIQENQLVLDSRFRGSDAILTFYESITINNLVKSRFAPFYSAAEGDPSPAI